MKNMKKSFLILTLSIFGSILLQAENSVIIKGKWERSGKEVNLYKVISGRLEPVSTYNLDEERDFGFIFTPKYEGFYAIGNGYPGAKNNKFLFYFEPGDQLNIEVNDSTYRLVGENTAENKMMTEWYYWSFPMYSMAVYFDWMVNATATYVDFFPLLEEAIANPFVIRPTANQHFNELFKRFTEVDFLSTAMHFLHTPRTAHPHVDEYPDFYKNIDISSLTHDDFLMRYPSGSSLLTALIYHNERVNGLAENPMPLTDVLAMIKDNSLKGEYLLSKATNIKTYLGYKELIDPYEAFLVTDDQKSRAAEIMAKLAKVETESGKVVNFTHKDVNGNDISLSDFKGKVVLVDVWATWCGPCIAQIPHLKTLEKKYEGKDVVFMGVSVDEQKDYEKWKEFLKKEELHGVQLFAGGFKSDIAKFYNINAIPRFMLFDKSGNLVSKDAPRPSDAELSILIDNELKK